MKVTALKPHTFAGRQRKPGDEYEINKQSDIELMIKIGHVSCTEADAPGIRVSRGTPAPVSKPAARTKRAYNRRDLTAQQ